MDVKLEQNFEAPGGGGGGHRDGAAGDSAPHPPILARTEVKKWNAVALWSWDLYENVQNCAFCRRHIMDVCQQCIECAALAPPLPPAAVERMSPENGDANMAPAPEEIDCSVAWGVCSHAFHFHCIARWLETHRVCPLDNKDWDFHKFEPS